MKFPTSLIRSLGRFDAVMMIMGNMIGIGIFTTTGFYSEYLNSPAELFLIWIFGALYSFCGALTYAEVVTRFPHAGGDYLFLNRAFHPLVGFLFGWSTFTVTYTGSIAAIAIGFSTYFSKLLPGDMTSILLQLPGVNWPLPTIKTVAIIMTFLLTWMNISGIRQGARFQNVFTLLGIATLLAFVSIGISSDAGSVNNFAPFIPQDLQLPGFSLLGVALIGVIFTYSGWTVLAYIAGEVKQPKQNIPLAMALAVLLVALLYMAVNGIYLYAQPLSEMSGKVEIGYQTLKVLFSTNTSAMFSLMIMLMVLSSLNSTILSGARIYYAMAKEGRFFKWAGYVHPKHRVPSKSLWLQFFWVVLLILLGKFNELLTFTVFVMVLFSSLAGVALFVLRKKYPNQKGIYHTWGYPIVPILYLIISFWILINTLFHRPGESVIGLLITLSGVVPFYVWWGGKNQDKD